MWALKEITTLLVSSGCGAIMELFVVWGRLTLTLLLTIDFLTSLAFGQTWRFGAID